MSESDVHLGGAGEGPFSALGRWADEQAIYSKKSHVRYTRSLSALGTLATLTSLVDVPGKRYVLSLELGLMAVLMLRSYASSQERNWYMMRALAESIKSLEWRVMMGLFEGDSVAAETRFKDLWESFRNDLAPELRIDGSATSRPGEITGLVQASLSISFEERKARYRTDRIESQLAWYSSKARFHLARWKNLKSLATGCLALVLILALSNIQTNAAIPVLLSLVAFAGAENSLAQNASVAGAYAVASEELQQIASMLSEVTEAQWNQFVGDSEESISREHVSWRVSRGILK